MQYRTASRLGRPLSAIGQSCWQLGADWGDDSEDSAHAVLDAAGPRGELRGERREHADR